MHFAYWDTHHISTNSNLAEVQRKRDHLLFMIKYKLSQKNYSPQHFLFQVFDKQTTKIVVLFFVDKMNLF
jgi:hypothetical protein